MANNSDNLSPAVKSLIIGGVIFLSVLTAGWTISGKALSNHECFVSITAREMLASGDWITPTCNSRPRLQKTPLSYWLVAGLAKITGRVDEFTARLPSAVFAVLLTVAVLYFVNQWLGFRIAVLSALVWATSLGCIRYAHNARPEMALTFFVSLCLFSFYSAATANTRKKQITLMLIFWISFGLANLAKGPAPLPLVLLPVLFYLAVFRRWKILPRMLPVLGPIIFLAIVLPWPLAIAHRMNWDLTLWKLEFVDRFFGKYAPGDKPWHYFLPRMFQFTAPWSAFLPFALAAPFYRIWGKKQHVMQFLWLWFVVDLAFLTVCGGKRQHYIIPLIPAMAILTGILMEDMVFSRRAFEKKLAKSFLQWHVVVAIVALAAVAVYTAKTNPQMLPLTIAFSISAAIVIVIVATLFAKGKPAFACTALFTGYCGLVVFCYIAFVNPLHYNRFSRDFSRKIARIVPPAGKLIAFEYISNRSVNYFGRPIPEVSDEPSIVRHYNDGNYIVATAGHLEKLQRLGGLRMVYYKQKAERRQQRDAPGALFHKSAPIVGKDP